MKVKNDEFDAEELNLMTLAKEYSDEGKARTLLESLRWPEGAFCPHCKAQKPYKLTPKAESKRPARDGVYKCRACRKQFTVTVGTYFEASHIPISKWLMAIFLLCSSKKAMSAHQLHRMLGLTYKTAWFMAHRIRFAMMPESPSSTLLDGVVEGDETYVGGKPRPGTGFHKRGKGTTKTPVMALVQRDGEVRTRVVANVTGKNIGEFIRENVAKGPPIHSDQAPIYHTQVPSSSKHYVVNHSQKEYARREADGTVAHCNTAESFFSLLKRGVYGAWHHVSKEHLPKYCDEFAFRWNHRKIADGERMVAAVGMIEGKRLTYRETV